MFLFAVVIDGTGEVVIVGAANKLQARRAAGRLRPGVTFGRTFRLLTSTDHDHTD
jgi:hypothetical protein